MTNKLYAMTSYVILKLQKKQRQREGDKGYEKIEQMTGRVAQAVEHLPS
jgi:hypothetical protein